MMRKFILSVVLTICFLTTEPVNSLVSPLYHLYLPEISYVAPHTSPKKGIAPNYPHGEDWAQTGAVWGYVYSSWTWNISGIEMIPMIRADHPNDPIGGGNSRWLLGSNEPDLAGIPMSQQVSVWHDVAETSGRLLVSPAPSHLHPEWLAQFRETYQETYGVYPHWDALAIHCYLTVESCKILVGSVIEEADAWGISGGVWVTEFAFDSSAEMRDFVDWMETQPRITRYAWYTNRLKGDEWWCLGCKRYLFDYQTGDYTPLGSMYAEIP